MELVAFQSALHGPLLRGWLERQHVRRWWGSPEAVMEELRGNLLEEQSAVILADSIPVGFICWQPYSTEELELVGESPSLQGAVDVDVFLGEPEYEARGIAARAVRLLVDRLGSAHSIPLIGACTSVNNARALRAAEKAGFRQRRRYEDPDWGPCWFMALIPKGSDDTPGGE